MEDKEMKTFPFQPSNSNLSGKDTTSSLNESHQMALHRSLGREEHLKNNYSSSSIEYHLTIRLKVQHFSRKEISLLLDVLNYQCVNFGVNLNMYLALFELTSILLGSKNSTELSESKIRLTVTVSEVILQALHGQSWSLWKEETLEVPGDVKNILKPHLMTKRTYGSRFTSYRPEKWLEVLIVPVNTRFLERTKYSKRYSSYTKGYGESHPSAHSQKTKSNSELDGISDQEVIQVEKVKLFNRMTNLYQIISDSIRIKFENWKDQ